MAANPEIDEFSIGQDANVRSLRGLAAGYGRNLAKSVDERSLFPDRVIEYSVDLGGRFRPDDAYAGALGFGPGEKRADNSQNQHDHKDTAGTLIQFNCLHSLTHGPALVESKKFESFGHSVDSNWDRREWGVAKALISVESAKPCGRKGMNFDRTLLADRLETPRFLTHTQHGKP